MGKRLSNLGQILPRQAFTDNTRPLWNDWTFGDDNSDPAPTGRVKYWNGSAWVAKNLKFWNGSEWVIRQPKFWNGSSWNYAPPNPPTFKDVQSTAYGGATTTQVITAPAGIADGDKLYLQIFQLRTSAGVSDTSPGAPTPPAGFVAIAGAPSQDGVQADDNCRWRVGWFVKTASGESGNYTVDVTGTNTTNMQCVMACYSGHGSIEGTPTIQNAAPANTNRTFPGQTTTVDGCQGVTFGWDWGDTGAVETIGDGRNSRLQNVLSFLADFVQPTAGPTGDKVNACNSASGKARGGLMFMVRPL